MAGLTPKMVVVPVDFSDESVQAVATAVSYVEDRKQVHVIHVLPELNVAEPGVIWNVIDNESRTRHAEQALEERFSGESTEGVVLHATIGDPGVRITEYASAEKADLIVMPSHGRRGLSRLLIGSVAERVLRLAHCPVLVLRD